MTSRVNGVLEGGLPVELVNRILELISDVDLRRLARVSHYLRSIVTTNARFYLQVDVQCNPESDIRSSLETARDITAHALRFNLRLAFSVECSFANSAGWAQRGYYGTIASIVCNDVFKVLSKALPLVSTLLLVIPTEYEAALQLALNQPAPMLRLCEFRRSQDINPPATGPKLPDFTFNGYAPRLERLTLTNVWLNQRPSAIWANVRVLRMQYSQNTPLIRLKDVFPALRHLTIGLKRGPMENVLKINIDLRDLRLTRLDILTPESRHGVFDVIREQLSLVDIPVVTTNQFSLDCGPIWEDLETVPELVLFAGRHEQSRSWGKRVLLCGSKFGQRLIRAAIFEHLMDTQHPITELSLGFAARLVEIHLTNDFVCGLVKIHGDLSILRKISVQLVPDPDVRIWPNVDFDSPQRLKCPRLGLISLYALDRLLDVDASDIEYLGLLVGQKERSLDRRASVKLELTRVRLAGLVANTVHELFPSIIYQSAEFREIDFDI